MILAARSSVDAAEVARFSKIAAEWWDPKGKFAPLHRFNPTRLAFIRDQALHRFGRDLIDKRAAAIGFVGTGDKQNGEFVQSRHPSMHGQQQIPDAAALGRNWGKRATRSPGRSNCWALAKIKMSHRTVRSSGKAILSAMGPPPKAGRPALSFPSSPDPAGRPH